MQGSRVLGLKTMIEGFHNPAIDCILVLQIGSRYVYSSCSEAVLGIQRSVVIHKSKEIRTLDSKSLTCSLLDLVVLRRFVDELRRSTLVHHKGRHRVCTLV